jgi:hypothetical protein
LLKYKKCLYITTIYLIDSIVNLRKYYLIQNNLLSEEINLLFSYFSSSVIIPSNNVKYMIELNVFLITRYWTPENKPIKPYLLYNFIICCHNVPYISTPLCRRVLIVSNGVVIADITLPLIAAGITLAYSKLFLFLLFRYY